MFTISQGLVRAFFRPVFSYLWVACCCGLVWQSLDPLSPSLHALNMDIILVDPLWISVVIVVVFVVVVVVVAVVVELDIYNSLHTRALLNYLQLHKSF